VPEQVNDGGLCCAVCASIESAQQKKKQRKQKVIPSLACMPHPTRPQQTVELFVSESPALERKKRGNVHASSLERLIIVVSSFPVLSAFLPSIYLLALTLIRYASIDLFQRHGHRTNRQRHSHFRNKQQQQRPCPLVQSTTRRHCSASTTTISRKRRGTDFSNVLMI